jgi:hypothetical protein
MTQQDKCKRKYNKNSDKNGSTSSLTNNDGNGQYKYTQQLPTWQHK